MTLRADKTEGTSHDYKKGDRNEPRMSLAGDELNTTQPIARAVFYM
jgi:hypothetical protein